jgi:hypothetical protein
VWEVDNGQTGTRVPLRRLRLFSPAYNHWGTHQDRPAGTVWHNFLGLHFGPEIFSNYY